MAAFIAAIKAFGAELVHGSPPTTGEGQMQIENEQEQEVNASEETAVEEVQAEESPATGDVQAGATPDADDRAHNVPVKALIEERRKRQEAQEQVRAIEARLANIERERMQQRSAPDPELSEDEILSDLPKAFKKQQEQFRKELLNQRYATSEAYARQIHKDYDEALQEYMQLAPNNPRVAREVEAAPLPALAMYDFVQTERQRRVASDPKALETKIQEEVQKRLESELAKLKGSITAAQVTPSIGAARGNGPTSKAPWSGAPAMSDILRGR